MRQHDKSPRSIAHWGLLAGLLGIIALLVAACGADDPTPTRVPTATPVPGEPTPTPRAAWEIEWDEVLAAAREEVEVVIAMGGSSIRNFAPRSPCSSSAETSDGRGMRGHTTAPAMVVRSGSSSISDPVGLHRNT